MEHEYEREKVRHIATLKKGKPQIYIIETEIALRFQRSSDLLYISFTSPLLPHTYTHPPSEMKDLAMGGRKMWAYVMNWNYNYSK